MCGVYLMGTGLKQDINCLMGAWLMWECWVFNGGKGGGFIFPMEVGIIWVKRSSLFNGVLDRV